MEMLPHVWQDAGANQMGQGQGQGNANKQDGNLYVRFYMGSQLNAIRTKEAGGVAKHDSVPCVIISVPGDRSVVIDRPVWDDPMEPNSDTSRFPGLWQKFLSGNGDSPQTGTPLAEWPMVTRAMVEDLSFHKIVTVEQMAGLSDVNAQKMLGSTELRTKAREWLQAAEKAAPFMAINADLKEKTEQVESLRAMLAETNRKLEELSEATGQTKKPSLKHKPTAASSI